MAPLGSARHLDGMRRDAAAVAVLLLCVSAGWAQDIGTIAGVEGSVQLGRGGTWQAASVGTAVHPGDRLRTGTPGRVRVVFQDDSVLTMADGSELAIDQQTFDAARGIARTQLRLVRGKVRALVSEYYGRPGSSYQIETIRAVAGVRGTEFVITFDPVADVSEVVGVAGRVEVHSVLDRVGHAVFVTAKEITTVARGKYPTPARRLDDELFRQYLGKLQFVGAGRPESLASVQPLLSGDAVPEEDRSSALAERTASGWLPSNPGDSPHDLRDVSSILQAPPGLLESPPKLGIRF